MSDYEFFRYVSIGQYLPLDSFVHKLDPRARIVLFTVLLLAATFTPHFFGLLIALITILALLVIEKIPMGYALRGLIPPLPFLIFLAILQIFFNSLRQLSPVIFQLGPIAITQAGLWAGVVLLIRFACLILILSLATFSLSPSELSHGLESLLKPFVHLGIPVQDFVMVVQVTLRFMPILAQTAERIVKAQVSRGAEWGTHRSHLFQRIRQMVPLVIPLFIASLHRAENLALAMELRGYGGQKARTSMTQLKFRWKDAITISLALCFAMAILLV